VRNYRQQTKEREINLLKQDLFLLMTQVILIALNDENNVQNDNYKDYFRANCEIESITKN
jgi:hypothetical protein